MPVNDGCAGILHVLADTECLPVWRRAVYSFLTYQGSHYGTVSWKLSKQRAQDILEDRDKIVELFEAVDDELRNLNADDTYDGIFEKIKLLERFKAVYNNQPSPATMEDRPSPEPHYSLQPLRRRNKVIPRGPGESRPVSKLHQPDVSQHLQFAQILRETLTKHAGLPIQSVRRRLDIHSSNIRTHRLRVEIFHQRPRHTQ